MRRAGLCKVSLVCCAALLNGTAALAGSLTIEMSGGIGPALTAKIAEYGLPLTVTVAKGKTLLETVVEICGNNPTYLTLVGSDRLKSIAAEDRPEEIPACARPASPLPSTVQHGDTLTKILSRNGFSEPVGLPSWPSSIPEAIKLACAGPDGAACKAGGGNTFPGTWDSGVTDHGISVGWFSASRPITGLGDRLAAFNERKVLDLITLEEQQTALVALTHEEFAKLENRNIVNATISDPDKLIPGMDVFVPLQRPEFSTVFLKDGAQIETIAEDLQRVAASESTQQPRITLNPEDALLISPSEDGCEGIAPDYRPFLGDDVIRQIGLNHRLAKVAPPKARKNVLVLDTGLDEEIVKDATPFPVSYFHRMARPLGTSPTSFGIANASIFGFNFATRQDVVHSPEGFSERWHGLNVIGAILGGAELEDYRYVMDLPVGVAIGSLMSFAGGEPKIEPGSLSSSLDATRAEPGAISVINASFISGKPISGLANAADNAEGVLLVVAAGNEHRDLDDWAVWPARYGGNPANSNGLTTVTVGGHRPDGSIWPKSARSPKYVDILAPACRVPTYTGRESAADQDGRKHISAERTVASGTSLSAPIVSMVATILSSYGLRPFEIKQRLTFASDFDPGLSDKAFSSGRLNIRRTLAFPFDVAIWEDQGKRRESLFRASFSSLSTFSICGKSVLPLRLGKLSRFRKPDGTETVRYWLKSSNTDTPELFEYAECSVGESGGTTVVLRGPDGTDTGTVSIPIAKLEDFVPAFSR